LPASKALRVWVYDLGVDSKGRAIQVYNASGTVNGVPYLLCNGPLAGSLPLDLTVQYIVLDRTTVPHPRFVVEEMPAATPPQVTGTPIAIGTSDRYYTNGAFYVRFPTEAGRTYYVQYTSDVVEPVWKTALPPITGTGGWVVWLDNGPPKTDSKPKDATSRFYQVRQAP
jgi:hypothetical protein